MPSHFDTDAEDAKLAALREKEEEDLARILSDKYGLTYTDLSVVPVNVDALRLVQEDKARAAEMVVFDKAGKALSIALHSPNNPALAGIFEGLESRGFTLQKFLVSARSLKRALDRYADLSYAHVTTEGVFDISSEDINKLEKEFDSLASLKSHLDEVLSTKKTAQVSRIFEDIVAAALSLGASDIHLEPEEHAVRLRLRLDGMLSDAYMFDPKVYHSLNSRVKLLSGLKLNVDNRAQDGRFTIAVQGTEIEVRTSVIPGNYGESLVLRILDPNTLTRSFEDMGVNPKLLARLREEIKRPNGMLLTTGPTGSGKTTTLYTFLLALHTPETKIVTIEDPIEYHLEGIVQTQTNGKDYTFASGLRSVLRQDPDVILVGEIRDGEVAEVALQAALTGHFVFSTLHTNNAAGTFPRLVDLGADPKVFASAVSVAMGQRLMRTLNPETKKARPATEEEKKLMQAIMATVTDTSLLPASYDTVYDAVPDENGGTGYKGRLGVHEAIFMDEELGEFLRDNPSEGDIAKHVLRQGYLTMAQDGVLKVLAGQTTLEELARTV
ncbi:MAG TPA: GspE/PulE family protein, partial [Candidatus Paceibacterota bacterium]|nr:GspE/PulE family protein [Candidatus Paceibacterota bacterium]